MKQKTIKNSIGFSGIGLHSGIGVDIKICPAKENSGIIFRRTDVSGKNNEIKALYNSVISTGLGTTIGKSNFIQKSISNALIKFGIVKEYGVVIRTIEHIMAALWACDIDNAIIEVNNKEIPIMDGSANIFIDKIQNVGVEELDGERKFLIIKREVEVKMKDKYVKLLPYNGYKIELTVDFNYGGIGKQSIIFNGNQKQFIDEFSKARTFCNIKDIEFMQKHDLALGGSEVNAMVFDNNGLLNKGGFIYNCEPVRHKLLDCIGDMFTSGYFMKCSIEAFKSGHKVNNQILKKLFSDRNNYTIDY